MHYFSARQVTGKFCDYLKIQCKAITCKDRTFGNAERKDLYPRGKKFGADHADMINIFQNREENTCVKHAYKCRMLKSTFGDKISV